MLITVSCSPAGGWRRTDGAVAAAPDYNDCDRNKKKIEKRKIKISITLLRTRCYHAVTKTQKRYTQNQD